MKQVSTMSDLFERLDDLKSVFRYGQKLIPIIQSIIDFMKETVPLLEDINTSIADSTSKIPKAKDQISNISSATELATTEILDIADLISADLDKIKKELKTLQERETRKKELWKNIKGLLKNNSKAKNLIMEFEQLDNTIKEISNFQNILDKINNDVYNITLSLQVQDITSQQLAAVNHLIESVRHRLSSLMLHLDNSEINAINHGPEKSMRDSSFNPDAVYSKSSKNQELADSLVNNTLSKTSQDEIDKLFS
jgi:chemotaxis regulatin CheY-phosphate phosphatase CheZ